MFKAIESGTFALSVATEDPAFDVPKDRSKSARASSGSHV